MGALEPVTIDVTDATTIEAAVGTAEEAIDTDGLAGIVNNAGVPVTGPMEALPVDRLRRSSM